MRKILFAVALAFAPLTASAERAQPAVGDARPDTPSVDAIVGKHLAALGGEKLLRSGKTIQFTVSGEKLGKKFSKTVTQARPNKLRVDITGADGAMSKGFDGKVAWVKKGDAPAVALGAEETAAMALHATFDEPLLDYAKKGTTVKLVGKTEVKGAAAYDLQLTLKNGDIEHHFLDANSYLLVKKTWTGKDKDGTSKAMAVRFGDYKKVQGRAVNHSVTWDGDDGTSHTSTVSNIRYDKPVNAKLFAMPR